MRITFDPAKEAKNLAKHDMSLAMASRIEWESALVWLDDRKDYREDRFCAIGYIGLRLHFAVFTYRGQQRRMISLRKANRREVKRYAKA